MPGDLDLQEELLDECLAKNPELGVDTSRGGAAKSTKPRAQDVRMSAFLSERGTEKSSGSVKAKPKWDRQWFGGQMKMVRGWSETRVNNEWSQLLADTPAAERGMAGPPEAPIQLPIQTWMVGREEAFDQQRNFQSRSMLTKSKPQVMKEHDIDMEVANCGKGFGNSFLGHRGLSF